MPNDRSDTPLAHDAPSSGLAGARLQDDCFRPGQGRMRHAEALDLIRTRIARIARVETVAIAHCARRVLAGAVTAPRPVPAHTNAAVDGYAFLSSPQIREHGASLAVVGRAAAGHPLRVPLDGSSAARILTGAVMPEGADTVVMQEDVSVRVVDGELQIVDIPPGLKPGANVRKAGEDVAPAATLFAPGHVLRPQDVAALASVGLAQVACFTRVRVGIISTGDEVIAPGAGELGPGQVYDANAPMLEALCELSGATAETLGIWPDKLDVVRQRLADAARHYDVLLTSGGASLGEEDHLANALGMLGQRHMWQLAIKPGRPIMFGQIAGDGRDTVVAALPGNPVAVFVCFLIYVLPMLRALGGAEWREPRRYPLPAAFEFRGRKTGRREFWRGMIVERSGAISVDKFARDGSGLISGLTAADGLIDIPEDHGDVQLGDPVSFIPMGEFGIG